MEGAPGAIVNILIIKTGRTITPELWGITKEVLYISVYICYDIENKERK